MYERPRCCKADCGGLAGWMVAGAVRLRWMVGVMGHLNKLVLARHGCRRGCRSPDQSRRRPQAGKEAKIKDQMQTETTLSARTLWPSGLRR